MSIEITILEIERLLNQGLVANAIEMLAASSPQLSEEPRALVPVLGRLDRQRNDDILIQMLSQLSKENILPYERLIFEMRLNFRAQDYTSTLEIIEQILSQSGDNVEALRTGGRIGNLTHDEDLALGFWERLAHAAPGDPEAPLQAARLRLRRREFEEALEWARLAARLQPTAPEPAQIAVSAGLETGWPEACDSLLARLFIADQPQALRTLSRLARQLDCEKTARLVVCIKQQQHDEPALNSIIATLYSEWLAAGFEHELASREVEAAAFYRAARAVQPDGADAQRALDRLSLSSVTAMRAAFYERDFDRAIEYGLVAARLDTDVLEVWETLGRAQFAYGDIAAARDAFRRCTELNPADAQSWLPYGLALNHSGDRLTALKALRKARSLLDAEASGEADAAIATLYPLLVGDAHQATEAGDVESACDLVDAALTIRPNDRGVAQLRRDILRRWQDRVRQEWNRNSDSVVGICRRYLEKSPSDRYVATVLGRTLMRLRAYAEALPVWERLSTDNHDDSLFHLQLARCCRALKLREKGLAAAQSALALDPELKEAAEVAEFLERLG